MALGKDDGKILQLPAASENSKLMAPVMALLDQDPEGSVTESDYESWFERMGSALVALVLSPFVMSLSIAILWTNERRAARMDALIAYGETDCICVEQASPDDRGELVHVASGRAVAKSPIESKLFKDVLFKGGLRLRTTVEVFQWVEVSETKEKKDMIGGGKTKTTTYTYEKKWSSIINNSESYHNKKMKNRFPISPQVDTTEAAKVEYESDTRGAGWSLPAGLVSQFTDFESAVSAIGSDQVVSANGITLRREGDYFYSAAGANPQIGDVRTTFAYVPDNQQATIIALQSEASKALSMTETFLPYRPIFRGCCGISDEAKRNALLTEGQRSTEELADADDCLSGPLACLSCCCLCCCSFVSRAMAEVTPAQIFNLYPGFLSKRECFSKIRQDAAGVKWVLRLIGWICLHIAMMMFFQPFFMLLNVVPLLEYLHVTDAVEAIVFFLALVVTAVISFIVVSVAYLAYRPLVAMLYFTIGAAIASVPLSIHMGYLTSPV